MTLADKVSGGAVAKRAASRRRPVDTLLARELDTVSKSSAIDSETVVRSLCPSEVDWNNLKYQLHRHYAIDPKLLTPELTLRSLKELEAAASAGS